MPSVNKASSLSLIVAPVVGFGLITGGCGIGMPRYCSMPAVLRSPPLTPRSCCANAGIVPTHSVSSDTLQRC
jgi:hypothetical protein